MSDNEQYILAELEAIKEMPDSDAREKKIELLVRGYGYIQCASAARKYDVTLAKKFIQHNKEVCFRSGGHVVPFLDSCKCSLCENEIHLWKIQSSHDGNTVHVCMKCGETICENPWNEGDFIELKFQ